MDNIASLCSMLSRAGFQQIEYRLLQYICCRPAQFTMTEKIDFGRDHLHCQLSFVRSADAYAVIYYDASLIKELAMPGLVLGEVDLVELESAMQAVDWQQSDCSTTFRLDDQTTWQREKAIDQIVSILARLSATEQGKGYADALKVRFWSGTLLEQLTGNLAAIRSKLEVSQRFYFMDGECISVDQAYLFLQNRWLERRMIRKRKADSREDVPGATAEGQETRLLRKKRLGKGKKPIS